MRTLVAKEIRLLFPAFAVTLLLILLGALLSNSPNMGNIGTPYLFWFGFVLLAVSSFGREFGLKTLPFLLAQPVERGRIWRTKIAVLAVFMVLAFGAWWLSWGLGATTGAGPTLSMPLEAWAFFGLLIAVFTAGGLWMALLLRQMTAAFWFTFLLPIAPAFAIKALDGADWIVFAVLCLYAVAAFLLAWRQFLHLQDTAWTGGVITFGGGRAAVERSMIREYRPWSALFWKEMQLQQVTLLGMAGLLVLNLAAVALRKAGAHTFSTETLMILDGIVALWFVVPLLAGSQSVADERKLGTMQASLCLPISRRAQWFVKLMLALVLGGLLSWALFWAVASVAGNHLEKHDLIETASVFLLLTLAGFYGSTVTGGVVQALAAATLTLVGAWAALVLPYWPRMDGRSELCTGDLPFFIGWPMLVATLLWLAYRNFRHVSEDGRLWWRNALTLVGIGVLSIVLTVGIYHRAWECLTPLEPPPGPARLSLEKPPLFHSDGGGGLAALLPDGRFWVDQVSYGQRWPGLPFFMSLGGNGFAPGSNWVDAAANWRESVAIRSDGTLWVSEKPRPFAAGNSPSRVEPSDRFVQLGRDTNWLSVAPRPGSIILLLQRDGTLWEWGANSPAPKQAPPSLRDLQPHRLGNESDWATLQATKGWIYAFAWKKDGSAWILRPPRSDLGTDLNSPSLEPGLVLLRWPGLDNTRWRSLIASDNMLSFAGVRDDGTLWCWNRHWARVRALGARSTKAAPANGWDSPEQIGKDSNWAELTCTWERLVARKTDGSLWAWEGPRRWEQFDALRWPPVRLGTRNDWLALGVMGGGILSLAEDGNLWSWPDPSRPVDIFGDSSGLQLAASRKPVRIENIFGAKE